MQQNKPEILEDCCCFVCRSYN